MRETFHVKFRKTAHVSGRRDSWAEYDWNDHEECWISRDGKRSEGFFTLNPEFTCYMSDEKMTLYSLK